MMLVFHPLVQSDVLGAIDFYSQESGAAADRFYGEFLQLVEQIRERPESFHFSEAGLRRANFKRFPYHMLFRNRKGSVKIMIVKHHKRHPSYGLRRR